MNCLELSRRQPRKRFTAAGAGQRWVVDTRRWGFTSTTQLSAALRRSPASSLGGIVDSLGRIARSSPASSLGGIVDSLGRIARSSPASYLGGIVDSLGWTVVEPVYGTVIQLARLAWKVQGLRFTVTGVENLPRTGGAVIAINHTSYFDFTFAGLPAYRQGLGRKVRFMAKEEVFTNKISGPIMRSLRHIPVDRSSGSASFAEACRRLKEGELVGVYPEATISRSFEMKEFKSGAARMAIAADVPIVPHIVWGAQRIWTKDHPKKLGRPKVPISVAVGEPIPPTLPAAELTTLLHARMQHLLEQTQDAYPDGHPAGAYWVPKRLGGSAPSLAEATRLDAEEAAARAAAKAARQAEGPGPG